VENVQIKVGDEARGGRNHSGVTEEKKKKLQRGDEETRKEIVTHKANKSAGRGRDYKVTKKELIALDSSGKRGLGGGGERGAMEP